jgi:hypothetical protein
MAEPKKTLKSRPDVTNSAITAAGATTAGVAALAGGIPKAQPDLSVAGKLTAEDKSRGVRRAAKRVKNQAMAAKLAPGGILGFRTGIHEFGTGYLKEKAVQDKQAKRTSPDSTRRAYDRGNTTGKIGEENKIIRGMKTGRKVSHGALAVGVGTAGYGMYRSKKEAAKKQAFQKNDARTRSDKYSGALLGTGATGAAISHGTSKYLDRHYKRYSARSGENIDAAGKLAPKTAGREGDDLGRSLKRMDKYKKKNPGQPWPKTMYPKVTDDKIAANPKKYLGGVDHKTAEKVGRLRGIAGEQRHYAEVFQNTAKTVRRFRTPSLAIGAAGAGGVMANKDKKVKKSHSVSAFGVEHADEIVKNIPKGLDQLVSSGRAGRVADPISTRARVNAHRSGRSAAKLKAINEGKVDGNVVERIKEGRRARLTSRGGL